MRALRPSGSGSVRLGRSCRVYRLCRAVGRVRRKVGIGRGHTTNLRSFVSVNLSTASILSKGCGESLILPRKKFLDKHIHIYDTKEGLNAANTSGLSRYCQYSRLGIGSMSEAGNERRLRVVTISKQESHR